MDRDAVTVCAYEDESVTIFNNRAEDILPCLQTDSAAVVLTDIPYNGVNRDSSGLRDLDRGEADSAPVNLAWIATESARLAPSVYVFCGWGQFSTLVEEFDRLGMSTRVGVWHKTNPSPMNGEHLWLSGVELCVFARRKGATFTRNCEVPVWRGATEPRDDHPTAKPEWLWKHLLLSSAEPGDLVVDPFNGSGTTTAMAKLLGMRAIGIDINPAFCEVAATRVRQGVLPW